MPNYHVEWAIDIDAETPELAARKALIIQRDPTSRATVFHVGNGDRVLSRMKRVDLTPPPAMRRKVDWLALEAEIREVLHKVESMPVNHLRGTDRELVRALLKIAERVGEHTGRGTPLVGWEDFDKHYMEIGRASCRERV